MSKITIVTAFFSIGRENWNGFQKTDEEYFRYFEFWAGLKNKLIAYVSHEEQAKEIYHIRDKFGQKDNTICVVIEDIFSVDKELYASIEKVSKYERVGASRLFPNNPESWNPDYNYIMLMKEWCAKDAVEKGYAKGMVAWVDFGINKGGAVYTKKEEFQFLWEYPFPTKINLFTLSDIEDRPPIYEMIRDMSTVIQGGVIVAPDFYWDKLWSLMRQNMMLLNKIGFMDDDQTILLMSFLDEKECFALHSCDWIMQFKDFGNPNLTLRAKPTKRLNILKRAYILFLSVIKGKNPEIKTYLRMQKQSILINKRKGYR